MANRCHQPVGLEWLGKDDRGHNPTCARAGRLLHLAGMSAHADGWHPEPDGFQDQVTTIAVRQDQIGDKHAECCCSQQTHRIAVAIRFRNMIAGIAQ